MSSFPEITALSFYDKNFKIADNNIYSVVNKQQVRREWQSWPIEDLGAPTTHPKPLLPQYYNRESKTGNPRPSHLCPMRSLCLPRAFSAMSWEENCTNASPVLRPSRSSGSIIPLGTISIPISPTQQTNHTILFHPLSTIFILFLLIKSINILKSHEQMNIIISIHAKELFHFWRLKETYKAMSDHFDNFFLYPWPCLYSWSKNESHVPFQSLASPLIWMKQHLENFNIRPFSPLEDKLFSH